MLQIPFVASFTGEVPYYTPHGYGFVTGTELRAYPELRIPEINSGFEPMWWYRDREYDCVRMGPEGAEVYPAACVREKDLEKRKHLAARTGYTENLRRYIRELRELGAVPVLVTSLARNTWSSETTYNDLLAGFFPEQFHVNDGETSRSYWQVWDRTAWVVLDPADWSYADGKVTIPVPAPFHSYTVSFLAYRMWEEISMYNHVTNGWDKEHLMPIDPRLPQAQEYLLQWLDAWCREHPATTVVRFTSMFYNFVWMWGGDERNRNLFTDWGSYDFTVSEKALADFEAAYGYALTAEDFINRGNFQVTHMPPTARKRDYMEFTQKFVAEFGSRLVKLVQGYGKSRRFGA